MFRGPFWDSFRRDFGRRYGPPVGGTMRGIRDMYFADRIGNTLGRAWNNLWGYKRNIVGPMSQSYLSRGKYKKNKFRRNRYRKNRRY